MSDSRYTTEYELRASTRIIYPYLYTAGGLSQWFADDVIIRPDKKLVFLWDDEEFVAEMVSYRNNKSVKFEFVDHSESEDEKSTVELVLETNELTQSVYLKIVDESGFFDSEEEFLEIWDGAVDSLKQVLSA